MIKKIFIIFILFIVFIIVSAFSYSNTVFSALSENVFRLHVVANSNSAEDQNLKYLVRDKVLEYMNTVTCNAKSKEEIIVLLEQNLENVQKIAQAVICENGFSYEVKLTIGEFAFPTKEYGDISLPFGIYDALQIKIGNASGQNWWCVMFPPLCFVDVTSGIVPNESKENLQENLSNEEYNIISSNNSEIKLKFKLLEFFNSVTSTLTAQK